MVVGITLVFSKAQQKSLVFIILIKAFDEIGF